MNIYKNNDEFSYRIVKEYSDKFHCCFIPYKVCASDTNPPIITSQQIGTSIPVDLTNVIIMLILLLLFFM